MIRYISVKKQIRTLRNLFPESVARHIPVTDVDTWKNSSSYHEGMEGWFATLQPHILGDSYRRAVQHVCETCGISYEQRHKKMLGEISFVCADTIGTVSALVTVARSGVLELSPLTPHTHLYDDFYLPTGIGHRTDAEYGVHMAAKANAKHLCGQAP